MKMKNLTFRLGVIVKAPLRLVVRLALLSVLGCTQVLAQQTETQNKAQPPSLQELRAWYNQAPAHWPKANLSEGITLHELAPLKAPTLTAEQKERVALGDKLFHDPILSRDKSLSCASCHEKRFVFTDARQKAIGIESRVGLRNSPALFNLDLWQSFFWDGRAGTLEQQVLMPIEDHLEMDIKVPEVLERLNQHPTYQAEFAKLYPKKTIDEEQLAQVLAAFSLSLTTPRTRYDDFIEHAYSTDKALQASATNVLSDDELRGLHLFRTKARCLNCHSGAFFTDNEFHVTGFHFFGREQEDLGRYRFTGKVEDSGKFRTPTLRSVGKTGPWMHNGNMQTMRALMAFYNVGGPQPRKPEKHPNLHLWPTHSPLLKNLELTRKEQDELISFMLTL